MQSKALLREVGFRTAGRTFVRHADGCTDVLNVQGMSGNTRESIKFTFNLGVHEESLAKRLNRSRESPPKSHFDCMLSERVGWVVPERGDLWWTIDAENSPKQVGAWVHGVVSEFVLPWYTACHTTEGLIGFLRKRGGWGAPDVLWALGEREIALEVLHRLDQRMPNREKLIADWKAAKGLAEA